jgi:His/Glu/Gln/Arg/opine family amino acid ABC transporter permease subunit
MDLSRYVFADPYLGWLLLGTAMTLLLSLVTTVAALAAGAAVSALTTCRSLALRIVGFTFVNVFRNLPPVPLILFLVLGVPGAWLRMTGEPFPTGWEFPLLVAGLSLNASAYVAEILRAGLSAVPRSQWDSCRVLGLGPVATRVRVIYPQALRVSLPALGNRLVHNVKNTTIALVVPLPLDRLEVVGQAGRIAGQTFAWTEPLLFAAAVHLLLAFFLGRVVNTAARRAQAKVEVAR